jgi:hypothetical protein
MARETLADLRAERDELRRELLVERDKRQKLELLFDMLTRLLGGRDG